MSGAREVIPEKAAGRESVARERNSILLIDDDEVFRGELAAYLSAHGLQVVHVDALNAARSWLADNTPDVIILDQFLGPSDSLSSIPSLRDTFSGGLLVLTGNLEPTDRVVGLELGADDFVSKLVSPREILARLRALTRRKFATHADSPPAQAAPKAMGGWELNTARYELLSPDGSPFHLTSAEFAILKHLHSHIGQVVSREELSQVVLHRMFDPLDRAIDNLVSKLRRKFETAGTSGVIKAVRSEGYVFVGFDGRPAGDGETH